MSTIKCQCLSTRDRVVRCVAGWRPGCGPRSPPGGERYRRGYQAADRALARVRWLLSDCPVCRMHGDNTMILSRSRKARTADWTEPPGRSGRDRNDQGHVARGNVPGTPLFGVEQHHSRHGPGLPPQRCTRMVSSRCVSSWLVHLVCDVNVHANDFPFDPKEFSRARPT